MEQTRRRSAVVLLAVLLALGSAPAVEAGAPGAEARGQIGSLDRPLDRLVSSRRATPVDLASGGYRPAAPNPRILLLSSGVAPHVLPSSLQGLITTPADPNLEGIPGGDSVGLGTFVASVVLQAAPGARITSVPVYDAAGKTDPARIWFGLRYAAQRASSFDAVLLAFPPSAFLDPTSAAMATGEWEAVLDAAHDDPMRDGKGRLSLGIPIAPDLLQAKTRYSEANFYRARRFAYIATYWDDARTQIASVVSAGVPVVAPAGDLGPAMQSVMGLSNLPDVITVGASEGGLAANDSSPGPGIDFGIKPDLLAPAGVTGLMPEGSALASALQAAVDTTLQPQWTAGPPPDGTPRAMVQSSFASAALVAAAAGGLRLEGVSPVSTVRAAIAAAAVPIGAAPVWAQGAGVLSRAPSKSWASERPLALGTLNLGLEPEGGAAWRASIRIVQGTPLAAAAALGDHARADAVMEGGAPQAVTRQRQVPSSEAKPVSATLSSDTSGTTLTVTAQPGDTHEAGLWCGWTTVTVPLSSNDMRVPTCLTEGTKLRGSAFAIHKRWAAGQSFALFPTLPPGVSLAGRPLAMFHLDPLAMVMLYERSTEGPGGDAVFHNIVPGYYKVKLFADYGGDLYQTLGRIDGPDVTPVATGTEPVLGGDIAYQAFTALILPPATEAECSAAFGTKPGQGIGTLEPAVFPCDAPLMERVMGREPVAEDTDGSEQQPFVWEGSKWSYAIGPKLPTDERFRVLRGCDNPRIVDGIDGQDRRDLSGRTTCFRKAIGTTVLSRVVDLVPPDDLAWWTISSRRALDPETLLKVADPHHGPDVWERIGGDEKFILRHDPIGSTVSGLGVAAYPFNLTTPNYSAHISLNFTYELRHAFMLVLVVVGQEAQWGVVAPDGTFTAYPSSSSTPFDMSSGPWSLVGRSTGAANFEMGFLPRGAAEGVIVFVAVPPQVLDATLGALTGEMPEVSVGDLSFETRTWTPADWPAKRLVPIDGLEGVRQLDANGHAFAFNSRLGEPRSILDRFEVLTGKTFDESQIADPPLVRTISNGVVSATVTEDWEVMVHSPGDHARTVELCDVSAGRGTSAGHCQGTRRKAGSVVTNGGVRITRAEMAAAGAGLFDHFDVAGNGHKGPAPLIFSCSLDRLWELAGQTPPFITSDGSNFEILRLPLELLREHPRAIEVHIEDYSTGRRRPAALVTEGAWQGSLGEDTPGTGAERVTHACGPRGEADCTFSAAGAPTSPGAAPEVSPYVRFIAPSEGIGWAGRPDPGWSLWSSFGGIARSSPDLTSWGPGHLDMYVKGTDQMWVRRFLRAADPQWSSWTALGNPPAATISSPAGLSTRPGRTEIIVNGNGSLWRRTYANHAWSLVWERVNVPCGTGGCPIRFDSGPDAASWRDVDGRADLVVIADDGELWHTSSVDDAQNWNAWSRLGRPTTGEGSNERPVVLVGDPAIAAPSDGSLLALVRGQDGNMYHRRHDGAAWSPWSSAGAPPGGLQGGIDASGRGSFADAVARGPGNVLWSVRWSGDRWGAWTPLDGALRDDPTIVAWGPDRLDVFIRGNNDELWHRTWEPAANTVPVARPNAATDTLGWNDPYPLGGLANSSADLTALSNGDLHAFVRGDDHQMWGQQFTASIGRWSGWQALGQPAVGIFQNPGAASPAPGRVDLFITGGTDKGLWRRTFSAGAWSPLWEPLGTPCPNNSCIALASGPDATSWGGGRLDVVSLAADGKVWHRAYDGAVWSGWSKLGAPPGGAATEATVTTRGVNRLDVLVTGYDGSLWHRSWDGSDWAAWQPVGGPVPGAASGPDAAALGQGLEVFVRAVDRTLWRGRSDGTTWAWSMLETETARGPGVAVRDGKVDLFAPDGQRRLRHRRWTPDA